MPSCMTSQRVNLTLRDEVYRRWHKEGRVLKAANKFYGLLLYHALTVAENNPVKARLVEVADTIGREDPAGTGHITLWFPDESKRTVFNARLRAMHRLIGVPMFNYHILNVAMGCYLRGELPEISETLLLEWQRP